VNRLFSPEKCFNRCFSASSLRKKVYSNDTGDEVISSASAKNEEENADPKLAKKLGCLLVSTSVAKADVKMMRVSFDGVNGAEQKKIRLLSRARESCYAHVSVV
jgi:hypothetical protein